MRYVYTESVYKQMSFNEGVGQNILNWIREKWRKLIEWIKSIKDKIFKPKRKEVEDKIQQLENMAMRDMVITGDMSDAYNSADRRYYNKYTIISIDTFLDPSNGSIDKKFSMSISNTFNTVIDRLGVYLDQCIRNNWTQDQWKQKLEEVKKIIAENGNISIGRDDFSDKNSYNISQVSDDKIADAGYSDIGSYAYGSNNDRLHDATLKNLRIKSENREVKTLNIKLGDLVDFAKKDLAILYKYEDMNMDAADKFRSYEEIVKHYGDIPEAVELVRIIYDYTNRCYIEMMNKRKDIIIDEMCELNRVIEYAMKKVGQPIEDTGKVQESCRCNVRIV